MDLHKRQLGDKCMLKSETNEKYIYFISHFIFTCGIDIIVNTFRDCEICCFISLTSFKYIWTIFQLHVISLISLNVCLKSAETDPQFESLRLAQNALHYTLNSALKKLRPLKQFARYSVCNILCVEGNLYCYLHSSFVRSVWLYTYVICLA